MHSSAASSSPLMATSVIVLQSAFSGIFSSMVSNRSNAAFLIGIPSSTLCLNGPRSTSVMSSGLI